MRIANELGRGNAKAAKFSIKVLLGTSIAIGTFFFVLFLVFRKKLAYFFTDDERVADTVEDLSLLLSLSVLVNSIYPVLSGNSTLLFFIHTQHFILNKVVQYNNLKHKLLCMEKFVTYESTTILINLLFNLYFKVGKFIYFRKYI